MWGLLGKIFGSDTAIKSVVDTVSSGLDKLVYTDEEKAGDAAKDRSEARAMVVRWMDSTQGQNLARRIISLSITAVWLGMSLFAQLLSMVAIFTNDTGVVTAAKLLQVAMIAKESANDMMGAVMLILAFYFAAPHMGDIAAAAINKFGNRAAPPPTRGG